jgi:hypothetical protein
MFEVMWSIAGNIKIYSRLNERGCGLMVYICEHGNGPLEFMKGREFCDHVNDCFSSALLH